ISCEVRKSRKSKGFLLNKNTGVQSASELNESMAKIPTNQAAPESTIVAFTREKFLLSTSQATPGSIRETAELQAATVTNRKKTVPKNCPPGILPKAIGKL